jgi:ribonucleotide reductase beta subunit family protein with ferritin-like domain
MTTATKKEDILLKKNDKRFVLFPIQHAAVWKMAKQANANLWTIEEIAPYLPADLQDWAKLTSDEQKFIKHVLAFFAVSEGVVIENLCENFCKEIQLPEARSFYCTQIYMENIHSEMYSLLIDTYITDAKERFHLLDAMKSIPTIEEKTKWGAKWISETRPYAQRLVAFSIVEGVFFSGSFCAIFWLKKRNLMAAGLGLSNQWISRDEGLHTEFACLLYTQYCDKLSDTIVHEIIKEAVDIEKNFVCSSLPVDLIGMNSNLMSQYICFVADRLLLSLGHTKLYNATNPFDWMEKICLDNKTNFFEHGVAEYRKSGIQTDSLQSKTVISQSSINFDKLADLDKQEF